MVERLWHLLALIVPTVCDAQVAGVERSPAGRDLGARRWGRTDAGIGRRTQDSCVLPMHTSSRLDCSPAPRRRASRSRWPTGNRDGHGATLDWAAGPAGCDEYLSTTNGALRDGTRADYRTKLDCYVLPWLGKRSLASLDPAAIRVWLGELAKTTSKRTHRVLSADTQIGAYNVLRIMLVAAKCENKVQALATEGAAPPPKRIRTDHWSVDQVETFRRYLRESQDRLAALFETAVGIGLRKGEVLGLTWAQVHLDDIEPYIDLEHQLRRGRRTLGPTKGGDEDTRDVIVLPSFVAEAVRQHRARQEAERLAIGRRWKNDLDLVFTTPTGAPIDGSTLTRLFHRRTQVAGLPQARYPVSAVDLSAPAARVDICRLSGILRNTAQEVN